MSKESIKSVSTSLAVLFLRMIYSREGKSKVPHRMGKHNAVRPFKWAIKNEIITSDYTACTTSACFMIL